jgi:hypothetical protein
VIFALTALASCSNQSSDSSPDAREIQRSDSAPANTQADSGQDVLKKQDSSNVSPDSLLPTPDASVPPGLFLNGFFPIGAFNVPPSAFTKWKKRGVNTLVGEGDEGETRAEYSKTAVAVGFKLIREPLDKISDDIGNTDLLAWSQMDEPDAYGGGNKNLSELRGNYKEWKELDPARPVFLNFGGSDVMSANNPSAINTYKDMIATADWIANDRYPMSGYLNQPERRNDITLLSEPIDQLRSWDPTKPQFCFIESAAIYSEYRSVIPGELRAQMWLAIVHGVRGLFFFSHIFDGDSWADWDGTPDDVAAEMTTQNSIITSLAWVLQGEINPASMSVVVPKGLEAGWRNSSLGKYVFVVNTSGTSYPNQTITLTGTTGSTTATVVGESRTLPVTGGGTTITDSFGAFAVHIYNIQ